MPRSSQLTPPVESNPPRSRPVCRCRLQYSNVLVHALTKPAVQGQFEVAFRIIRLYRAFPPQSRDSEWTEASDPSRTGTDGPPPGDSVSWLPEASGYRPGRGFPHAAARRASAGGRPLPPP
ncbi:hypothetical protein FRAAL6205 [Frankia alni ACN14a]|uniref:Uncharacterized protein n=1 Tax=Frankia alni (strain DSM 45986 / CECT 9034 / ACN14a) TaxID=326424 RepID=Q0RCJ6_FRAAA|nr:hypothetical protein FRAAL6205 [Frankia alni ACN14a]